MTICQDSVYRIFRMTILEEFGPKSEGLIDLMPSASHTAAELQLQVQPKLRRRCVLPQHSNILWKLSSGKWDANVDPAIPIQNKANLVAITRKG